LADVSGAKMVLSDEAIIREALLQQQASHHGNHAFGRVAPHHRGAAAAGRGGAAALRGAANLAKLEPIVHALQVAPLQLQLQSPAGSPTKVPLGGPPASGSPHKAMRGRGAGAGAQRSPGPAHLSPSPAAAARALLGATGAAADVAPAPAPLPREPVVAITSPGTPNVGEVRHKPLPPASGLLSPLASLQGKTSDTYRG
jgi:hypothetical protein